MRFVTLCGVKIRCRAFCIFLHLISDILPEYARRAFLYLSTFQTPRTLFAFLYFARFAAFWAFLFSRCPCVFRKSLRPFHCANFLLPCLWRGVSVCSPWASALYRFLAWPCLDSFCTPRAFLIYNKYVSIVSAIGGRGFYLPRDLWLPLAHACAFIENRCKITAFFSWKIKCREKIFKNVNFAMQT